MEDLFAAEPTQLPFVAPETIAVLLLTSGTSGPPKVAVLRHEHLVPYVISTVEFACASADEAILVSVPPYHIAGISSVLTSVYAGRRMVQLAAFSAPSPAEPPTAPPTIAPTPEPSVPPTAPPTMAPVAAPAAAPVSGAPG